MSISRWWSRSRGLPPADHRAWQDSFAESDAGPARILAWARTSTGLVVGSPAMLSYSTEVTDGSDQASSWLHVGWHVIERGGWNSETRELSWAQYGGRRGKLVIAEPARLPELFRERVAASIVVERFVPVQGERGVTVSGRRDLGPAGTISWHASLGRGLTWSTPGASETAEIALEQLRTEYAPGELPRLDSNQQPAD